MTWSLRQYTVNSPRFLGRQPSGGTNSFRGLPPHGTGSVFATSGCSGFAAGSSPRASVASTIRNDSMIATVARISGLPAVDALLVQ